MCDFCRRVRKKLWRASDAWERTHSNDAEIWSKESDQNREALNVAAAMNETDPATLQAYLEAAEAGSVVAMGRVAWQYWTGTGTAPDLVQAEQYYRRAIEGGSWTATIHYARLLDELGQYGMCDKVLEDGIASGFVPAYFWLAWLRYKRSNNREICKEVRLFLEHAARAGHPGARYKLMHWMLMGRFGPWGIIRGFLLSLRLAHDYGHLADEVKSEAAAV